MKYFHDQWRIPDFPDGERQLSRWGVNLLFGHFFPENRMKMKEIGSGERASLAIVHITGLLFLDTFP